MEFAACLSLVKFIIRMIDRMNAILNRRFLYAGRNHENSANRK